MSYVFYRLIWHSTRRCELTFENLYWRDQESESSICCSVLQCGVVVPTRSRKRVVDVVQCGAVWCSVVQCYRQDQESQSSMSCIVLRRVAAWCSVSNEACCSVVQCFQRGHESESSIWYNVLQCVAVCCSVLQCSAVLPTRPRKRVVYAWLYARYLLEIWLVEFVHFPRVVVDADSYVWHDSFICIHMCAMTHSHVCHDSCMCMPWLIH